MRRLGLTVLLVAGGCAFAQVESDTFTVNASRQVNLQPDQVVFNVDVQSGLDSSLDKVLSALQGTGISSSNFAGVSFPSTTSLLFWEFTLSVPLSAMHDTASMLTALRQMLAKGQTGLLLTFNVQGTQVSQELQAASCSNAALISDARAQAQNMANAAGFTVGPLLSISTAGTVVGGSAPPAPAVFGFASITNPLDGTILPTLITQLLTHAAPVPPVSCSATVKFRLLRYH